MRTSTTSLSAIVTVAVLLFASPSASAQTTWYVDDDAAGDPSPGDPAISDPLEDGSLAHPFDAIQEGIDAAGPTDEVVVLDGTYTGVGNRDIAVTAALVGIRSQSGPEVCVVDCEQAGRGFLFDGADASGVVLDGFTVMGGMVAASGGGVHCVNDASPTIANCIITGNSTELHGGGVCGDTFDATLTLSNCTISGNSASAGGGVYGMDVTISNCTISGNAAASGGGVYGWGLTISGCTIVGNAADRDGGIHSLESANITDCTITENTALTYVAGISLSCTSGWTTIERCTISRNVVEGTEGSGGGVTQYCGDLKMIDSVIADNECGFTGGGLNAMGSGTLKFVRCSFLRNSAGGGAGAYLTARGGVFRRCVFADNVATFGSGAAAYCFSNSSPEFSNCIFTGNSSFVHGGAIRCFWSSNPAILNCTFAGNSANDSGGAVCVGEDCDGVRISNCVLWDNMAAHGEELALIEENVGVEVSYCDVRGGSEGVYVEETGTLNWLGGNIDADPFFAGPAGGDYRLTGASPCIDAGDNDVVPADVTTDFDGLPRFIDYPTVADTGNGTPPIVDMGAYEFGIGDLNCDGVVNLFDVDAFVLALISAQNGVPEDYYAVYAECDILFADLDGDGSVNAFDVDPFVGMLVGD